MSPCLGSPAPLLVTARRTSGSALAGPDAHNFPYTWSSVPLLAIARASRWPRLRADYRVLPTVRVTRWLSSDHPPWWRIVHCRSDPRVIASRAGHKTGAPFFVGGPLRTMGSNEERSDFSDGSTRTFSRPNMTRDLANWETHTLTPHRCLPTLSSPTTPPLKAKQALRRSALLPPHFFSLLPTPIKWERSCPSSSRLHPKEPATTDDHHGASPMGRCVVAWSGRRRSSFPLPMPCATALPQVGYLNTSPEMADQDPGPAAAPRSNWAAAADGG